VTDIVLPARLKGVEMVQSIRTPARLDYEFTAGRANSRFLNELSDKRLTGQRCPSCSKVYIPPRGACPTCGVPTEEEVELADRGTVTTFCIVNVPFTGQKIDIPYVNALILLDNADLPIFHLIQEIPYSEVHMGMRVEAVWKPDAEIGPTLESIEYFRPSGEPDADPATYRDYV